MTIISFKYWLQGFYELNNPKKINKTQVQQIKDHTNILVNKDYFIGWLDGFLSSKEECNKEECLLIQDMLNKEFKKITPDRPMKRVTPPLDIDIPGFDLKHTILC